MSGYRPKWSNEATDQLVKAFSVLENDEEIYRFLNDVCTIKEVQELGQRLKVAHLLTENETYNSIAQQTGASTATISRVKKFLSNGAQGYKVVLERLKGNG